MVLVGDEIDSDRFTGDFGRHDGGDFCSVGDVSLVIGREAAQGFEMGSGPNGLDCLGGVGGVGGLSSGQKPYESKGRNDKTANHPYTTLGKEKKKECAVFNFKRKRERANKNLINVPTLGIRNTT